MDDTPGGRNMAFGALWFVGGGIVTLTTFQAAKGGGTYVVAYGAIVAGLIQFIVGVVQFMGRPSPAMARQMQGLVAAATPTPSPELKVLIRAMVVTAEADGHLDDAEMDMIVGIVGKVTDNQFDRAAIRSLCWDATKRRGDFWACLRSSAGSFDAGLKTMLLRCCFMVMTADGQARQAELERLAEIASALGISEDDHAAVFDEFLTSPEEGASGTG